MAESPDWEVLWLERIVKKVNVKNIQNKQTLLDELNKLPSFSKGKDYSKQKDILIGNTENEKLIKGSSSVRTVMEENMEDTVRELEDIIEIKKLEPYSKKSKTDVQNIAFNTSMTRMRELRDTIDIRGLQTLKEEVVGLRDESELINSIDNTIERLIEKHGR